MWAANDLSPYFAIVKNFDRVLDQQLSFDACGDTWELNHGEEKVNSWEGGISARDEDAFSAFNEYQIGVRARDVVGKRYVSFQFQPGLPNAQHSETGEPLQSLPTDTYFRREDIHERSRVYDLALYVRLQRELSEEKIVSRNGLLERLAMVSSQQRGRGEYNWDNEEITGHHNAVALCAHSLEKLLPDQHIGKLLKSYHLKNPRTATDPDTATPHPKLEVWEVRPPP